MKKGVDRICEAIPKYLKSSSLAVQSHKNVHDIPERLILHSGRDPGFVFGTSEQYPDDCYVGIRQGTEGNIAVVGGNGSGKSAGIAKPTIERFQGAMCVTDVKGELSEHYKSLYHFGFVKRPYVIFDADDEEGPSYDPFDWLLQDEESHLVSNITEIALAILPILPSDNQPFWTETERGVFEAALLYYFKCGLSFSETITMILARPISALCKDLAASNDIRVQFFLGETASMKSETIASIDRGLRNKLTLFAADPYISHAFRGRREGANCFTWKDLDTHNIFLRIPADKIEEWGGAINLMYTQLIRYLERRPEQYSLEGKNNIQTLLLMDEFARFGKLEMITSAMATLRSKNVNICLIIQSIAQLDSIYGEYERHIIIDNCQFRAILRASDADTQKYLSELIGTCIRRQYSVGRQLDKSMDTRGYSQQISETREYQFFPHELSTLDDVLVLSPYGFCRAEKLRPSSFLEAHIELTSTANIHDCELPSLMDIPEYLLYKPIRNEGAKMLTIEERAHNAAKRIDADKLQKRLNQKHEREKKEMADKRRNYIIGELVTKYFPKLSAIEPGSQDENKTRFALLEAFLIELSSDEELVKQLEERARCWDLKNGVFCQPASGCVSGREKNDHRRNRLLMANYHLEVTTVSRGKGRSVTRLANYITGLRLHDSYHDRTCYYQRYDVLYCKVFLPTNAPPAFKELQRLCDEIEVAENRYDARTAREFKGSLPNELPIQELARIVSEYIDTNFISLGLCAIAAIHEDRNVADPDKNNPHVHIIVSTRIAGPDGFSRKKYREHDKRLYIDIWRKHWAEVQNRAYERNGLSVRVSHESLEVQGRYDRQPTIHLSLADWQREKRGERTIAGDRKREIEARNKKRALQQQLAHEHSIERSR